MDHRAAMEGTGDGAMPPYHQMGAPLYEGAGYGAEGEMARSYMGGPPVMNYMPSPANTSQGPTMGNPMGRPASMGAYSTSMAPQNNPGNPMYTPGPAQQKGYPGGIDQAMMGFSVPGPPMQIQPQPSGGPGSHYDYRPHMIEASSYGIKRSASFQNKMTPLTSENFVNMQGKGAMGQNSGGYPPNLYLPPHSHPRQASPTSHQVHMMQRSPGAMGGEFSDVPQGLLTPSRASLNLDLYEHHWPGAQGPEGTPSARQPQGPFRGEVRVPSRTNSFNNHQKVTVRQALPPAASVAGKQDASLGLPNTITAVTSPPIQPPVKSIRVMRPEPKTAVGPCHPGWLSAQAQDAPESLGYMPDETFTLEPNQEHRCPPPPYPKTLLLSGSGPGTEPASLETGVMGGFQDVNATSRTVQSASVGKQAEPVSKDKVKTGKGEKAVKDKKQIQTSPVPVRKNARDEEKRESRIKSYSPFAFKFYMEQHVENVMKTYQQKLNRRMQLEQEMSKVIVVLIECSISSLNVIALLLLNQATLFYFFHSSRLAFQRQSKNRWEKCFTRRNPIITDYDVPRWTNRCLSKSRHSALGPLVRCVLHAKWTRGPCMPWRL